MKKAAKIVSNDARFSRMLTLELIELGITVVNDLTAADDATLYTIVDLDACETEELIAYAENCAVIGYSHQEKEEITEKIDLCSSFLHRPFSIAEFSALFGVEEKPIRAELHNMLRQPPQKQNYLTVDVNEKAAKWGELLIPLSDCEYRVLEMLCENRGELVPRERIYALLGAEEGNIGDVYICHLRRKIDNKLGLKLIYTIRGKGYMLKN